MKFNDVIGQKEAKQRLMQMYGENRLPHAIMLCGPSGCGKMALALAFACHILRGGTEEDGKGEAMLAKMEHPDLHFTSPHHQAPGHGQRPQARERRFCRRMALDDNAKSVFHDGQVDAGHWGRKPAGHNHSGRKRRTDTQTKSEIEPGRIQDISDMATGKNEHRMCQQAAQND